MGWRPLRTAAAALVLATSLGACSGGSTGEADPSASSSAASPSASGSPTPTGAPSEGAAGPSGTGGRLLVVPADSPGTGRCSPAPRRGVVCSADRRTTYRFQPDAVRTLRVATAQGAEQDQVGWVLRVRVADADRTTLTRLTRTAQRTRQLLLLLTPGTRRLVSAPQVSAPITGGELQISGDLTEADVRRFVRQITSTPG